MNEKQVLLHKSIEIVGNGQIFLTGVNFSATLGAELARRFKADGQSELLHPVIGLTGLANKVFECGGTGSARVVKFRLVAHGTVFSWLCEQRPTASSTVAALGGGDS